ncbi:MAG: hypothetical protein M1813_007917 [Trichoglossum hirsutum]|nr:MAG: hypothetical protein M1813_007917 [Trichoglossum hirsutum]
MLEKNRRSLLQHKLPTKGSSLNGDRADKTEIANSEEDDDNGDVEVALLNRTASADETAITPIEDHTTLLDGTAPADETATTPLEDHTALLDRTPPADETVTTPFEDHANGICDGQNTATTNNSNAAAITPFATINQATREVQNLEVARDGSPNDLDTPSDNGSSSTAAESSHILNGVVFKLAHSTASVDSREHPDSTADGKAEIVTTSTTNPGPPPAKVVLNKLAQTASTTRSISTDSREHSDGAADGKAEIVTTLTTSTTSTTNPGPPSAKVVSNKPAQTASTTRSTSTDFNCSSTDSSDHTPQLGRTRRRRHGKKTISGTTTSQAGSAVRSGSKSNSGGGGGGGKGRGKGKGRARANIDVKPRASTRNVSKKALK